MHFNSLNFSSLICTLANLHPIELMWGLSNATSMKCLASPLAPKSFQETVTSIVYVSRGLLMVKGGQGQPPGGAILSPETGTDAGKAELGAYWGWKLQVSKWLP